MSLIGKKILHKNYGVGIVQGDDGKFLTILFPNFGNKVFEYPGSFSKSLKAADANIAAIVAADLAVFENGQMKLQIEKEKQVEIDRQRRLVQEKEEYSAKGKYYKRANVAFKCNYCDGGRSDLQVGFNGVCSDEIIHNNIEIEKRTWCRSEDCPCFQFVCGVLEDRSELESFCENGGFVCYESQMLRDWKALAGIVQNGNRKGEAMKLHQVQSDSLCVLTTREPNTTEADRFIFAVFLVTKFSEGDEEKEGFVSTTSEYKIKLAPEEAKRLLFWKYHANGKDPNRPVWGQGLHRYFEDDEAAQILRDIADIKKGTADEELAERFYQHFCKITGINVNALRAPFGALTM